MSRCGEQATKRARRRVEAQRRLELDALGLSVSASVTVAVMVMVPVARLCRSAFQYDGPYPELAMSQMAFAGMTM